MTRNPGRGRLPSSYRPYYQIEHARVRTPSEFDLGLEAVCGARLSEVRNFETGAAADATCDASWHENVVLLCDRCQLIVSVARLNGFAPLLTRADVRAMFELVGE